ncbi:MAG: sulfite exporter TauE/SafE family protein [Pseudomonadota bacterium]|nr:sulfite exporter TauE/SafE family protein [Pseudomonadota bacterium]
MLVEIMVITVGCFVAALVNAAVATGGVYIMLAASSAVLPLVAAIPMQAALAAPSLLARIVTFWPHIHWRIFAMFAPAAAVGVLIGAQVFVALDEGVISVALGGLLLLVWGVPKGLSLTLPHPFMYVGGLHGFFGTLFGVGLFLQPAMLRTQLNRLQITGTLAICLLVLEGMKATSYVGVGFDYSAYWPHILAGAVAGIIGNIAGHRLSGGITERYFRIIFKLVVTLAGLRLLAKGVIDLGPV